MIMGYGIIAVPTGIVTSEFATQNKPNETPKKNPTDLNTQSCPNCSADKHKENAQFCYNCGHKLNDA